MSKEIIDLNDIKRLVDLFYGKVKADPLLSVIFNNVIKDQWPAHLEKMYSFWQTVLLGELAYKGSPFPRHAGLPVTKEHFDQWLNLFGQSIDELFTGEKANEAKWRAEKMAEMFLTKIEYYRLNPDKLLV
jgi:hemoglobin